MIKLLTPALAIVAIVTMEIVAICHGIDGKVLTGSVAAVAAIGGYFLRKSHAK